MVSGTPSASGQFSFTVQVSDSSAPVQTAQGAFSIGVNPQNGVVISTSALPTGTVGTAYSTTLAAAGGTTPYSWTMVSGTLPAGLSLSKNGTISGTPTGAGQFNFTLQVTDSSSPVQNATKTFAITMSASVPALAITSTSMPNGNVGTVYSSTLIASGGTLPYSWTLASGSLPAGLSLSTNGTVSGTPTSAGQFSFTVQVTDSSSPVQNATKTFAITMSASVPVLTIISTSLPNGTVGTAYSTTLLASGGTLPYSWTLASGSLPAGLSLSNSGTLSGTPTGAGQSNFTVQVTDSSSPVQNANKAFSITMSASGSPLAITSSSLSSGTVGTAYSSTLTASGGTLPYSWTVLSGFLPAGLTLAKSGTISGTPTSASQSNFTAQVTDSSSPAQQASQALTITVVSKLAITGSVTPNAAVGVVYSLTDQASGGTPSYTWSVSAGALPPGLDLAASSGTISGTPNQNGTYNFTLEATDAGSPVQSATQNDKITVITSTNTAWSLQSTAVGWQFVAPNGGVTCKYNGLGLVDTTPLGNNASTVEAKYGGSWTTWAQQQSARMKSLGFNVADWYSYQYYSSWSTGMLPYVQSIPTSEYAMRDAGDASVGAWHVKDGMYIANPGGMKCGGSIFQGEGTLDPYDPAWPTAATAMMAAFGGGTNGYPSQANAMAAIVDETDNLVGIDEANNPNYSHADWGYVVLANSPTVDHSPSWAGGEYTYANHTSFIKEGMRDYLLNEYACTGNETPASCCTGRKTGTCSADPSSGSYIGAGNAGAGLNALNTAWTTSYTTWNTSDPNGLAGIIGTGGTSYTGEGFANGNGSTSSFTHTAAHAPVTSTMYQVYVNGVEVGDDNGSTILVPVGGSTLMNGNASGWQANHAYNVGDQFRTNSSGGNCMVIVTAAGTSGSSAPSWPGCSVGGAPGTGIIDGTAVETLVGPRPSVQYAGGIGTVTFSTPPPSGSVITINYTGGGGSSYSSWGTGTGFLDENGTNVISSSQVLQWKQMGRGPLRGSTPGARLGRSKSTRMPSLQPRLVSRQYPADGMAGRMWLNLSAYDPANLRRPLHACDCQRICGGGPVYGHLHACALFLHFGERGQE